MAKAITPKSVARQLPSHVQLAENELAVVARLVRVMRVKDYWIGHFIQSVLQQDTESTYELNIADVEKTLQTMKNLASWNNFIPDLVRKHPHLAEHPAYANRPNSGTMFPEDRDDQFYELVRLWRLDHPEPPKKPNVPSGHLCRTDEDDD
jgi:hypothetical protein